MSKFNREYYDSRASWKEFIVNEYLMVKYTRYGPDIYIRGKKFDLNLISDRCEHLDLMLNYPVSEDSQYSSVDEFANVIGWYHDPPDGDWAYTVDRKTEFWGCCSNLQVWAENDYDSNLLISFLAIPLLKALSDVGDPKAKIAYQKNIKMRALRKSARSGRYGSEFFKELEAFNVEERNDILSKMLLNFFQDENNRNLGKVQNFSLIIKEINDTELFNQYYDLIETRFEEYFNYIETLKLDKSGLWTTCEIFSQLVFSIKNTGIWLKYTKRIVNFFKILIDKIIKTTSGWHPEDRDDYLVFDDEKVLYHDIEPIIIASSNALLTSQDFPKGGERTFLINGQEISINDIARAQFNYTQKSAMHMLSKGGIHGEVNVPFGHPLYGVSIPHNTDEIKWNSEIEEVNFTYQDFMACMSRNPFYPGMYPQFNEFIVNLIESIKETDYLEQFLSEILQTFPKIPYLEPQRGFFDRMINAVKNTILEEQEIFKEWKTYNQDKNKNHIQSL